MIRSINHSVGLNNVAKNTLPLVFESKRSVFPSSVTRDHRSPQLQRDELVGPLGQLGNANAALLLDEVGHRRHFVLSYPSSSR